MCPLLTSRAASGSRDSKVFVLLCMPKAPTLPPFSHAVCAPLVIEASGHPAQGRCTRDVQTLPGASRLGNAHEGDTVQ